MGTWVRVVVIGLLLANLSIWFVKGYYEQRLAETPEGSAGLVGDRGARAVEHSADVNVADPAEGSEVVAADESAGRSSAERSDKKWQSIMAAWFGGTQCREFGPFAESGLASRLLGRLTVAGAEVELLEQVVALPNSYWVLAPVTSVEQGRQLGLQLTAISMRDWQVVKSSPLGLALSLGLFNTRTSAEVRLEQVKPVVSEAVLRTKPQSRMRYWVRASASEDLLEAEYSSVQTVRNCTLE